MSDPGRLDCIVVAAIPARQNKQNSDAVLNLSANPGKVANESEPQRSVAAFRPGLVAFAGLAFEFMLLGN
jgi:hypothetical protein